jgi:DNA-binding LacI/PurR family transcriptional regulator/DNA-binding transcriptional regulator YhcF (GntR family)
MAQRLTDTLVDKLLQHLEQSPDLPSIARLSMLWGVSYPTMAKAVRVLVKQGKIECFPGRGIRAVRSGEPAGEPAGNPDSKYRQVRTKLKSQILDGTIRSGSTLPKLSYFSLSEHISKHTIIAVLRSLEKEELIHKRGRFWIVGPRPSAPSTGPGRSQPAVVIFVPYLGNVRGLFDLGFNGRFMIPLNEELARQGIREYFVQMYTGDAENTNKRKAFRDADSLLRKLGEGYLGAIIHRGPYQNDEYQENMDAWVHFLRQRGKPVVFFDHNGNGGMFSRSRYGGFPGFYRFFFDEPAAVHTAMKVLIERGHRLIGFLVPTQDPSPWISRRSAMMEDSLHRLNPDAKIITIFQEEPVWYPSTNDWDDSMFERIMTQLRQKGTTVSYKSPRRALIEHTPSFKKLLAEQVTAIISPNDTFAITHYQWLNEAGIEVPRHLSLISFDNRPDNAPFPISTIDYGFGRLGYLAAHAFMGHLPMVAGKDGSIGGECVYVDKGSVGAPRKRLLKV